MIIPPNMELDKIKSINCYVRKPVQNKYHRL